MFKHSLRAQETRSKRHRNDVPLAQLAGHGEGQPYHGNFHQIVEKIAAVIESVAICDFENDPMPSTQHQRHSIVRSNDVRMDGLTQHGQAVLKVDRPERFAEFGECVTAPDIVDQNVESLMATFDAGNQLFHLSRLGMIHPDGDAAATGGGHQLRGFFNGFSTARSRVAPKFSLAAAGAVNGCARLAQRNRDSAPGAPSPSGYQPDLSSQ